MTGHVSLRRAAEEDVDELVALWAHYIRAHKSPAYRRLPPHALRERRRVFLERIRRSDSAIFVLAREEGGLDGMITCFAERNEPYFMPPRYARLQVPYVRPDVRRKGNLRRLLEAAFRWAREQELSELRLCVGAENVVANALAEELDFEAMEVIRRRELDWATPPEEQVDGDFSL